MTRQERLAEKSPLRFPDGLSEPTQVRSETVMPRGEPVLLISLQAATVTYVADVNDFFAAARLAAGRLTHSTGKSWRLDGWTSNHLYLRLDYGDLGQQLGIVPYLDEEFELAFGPSSVTVSVLTRLTATLALFEQLVHHLDDLLPRRIP